MRVDQMAEQGARAFQSDEIRTNTIVILERRRLAQKRDRRDRICLLIGWVLGVISVGGTVLVMTWWG